MARARTVVGLIDPRWKLANQWLEEVKSPWLVFRGDVFEVLAMIPDGTIDLIVTDPPYESLNKYRDDERRIREYEKKKAAGKLTGTRIPRLREWFPIMPNSEFPKLLSEFYRVLADNSHAYIFCDDETSDVISACVKTMVNEHGEANAFKWWKRIVWDKMTRGQGYHYANQHEFIVFLEKGKKKLRDLKLTSVLPCKRVSKNSLGGRQPGPAEKPVEIMSKLVLNSSAPGDLVFDPFCGRGPVGVAAVCNDREFLGIDLSQKAIYISRQRIRSAIE